MQWYSLPTHRLCEATTRQCGRHTPVVLVCCGSFNPPTTSHTAMFQIAQEQLEQMGFSVLRGYMSPVGDAYGKPHLAPASHRVAMCRLAAAAVAAPVMVDAWESSQPGYTRTLQVLQHIDLAVRLSVRSEGAVVSRLKVMLLCGSDLLASMATPGVWVQPDTILQQHGVVCLDRAGTDVARLLSMPGNVLSDNRQHIVHVEHADSEAISSSRVRAALAAGDGVEGWIVPGVHEYILEHGLYSTRPASQPGLE